MSKSTIALVSTWVLILIAGAFLGGYFWAKKNACKISGQNVGNVLINNEKLNDSIPSKNNSTSNSTPNNIQSNNTTNSTPTSNNGNGSTVVQPIQPK
jgi:hypothetical protein